MKRKNNEFEKKMFFAVYDENFFVNFPKSR